MKIKRSARAILAAAVLSLAVGTGGGAGWAAAPGVLDQVPSDAQVVIVVNNVRNLETKITNAAARLNMPVPPNMVDTALQNAGISKGFDTNSSAAFVLVKKEGEPKENEFGAPPLIVLLPTTDPKGMLENLQPGQADQNGVIELMLPGSSDKGYALVVDKWVALAQDRGLMAAYLKRPGSLTKSLTRAGLRVFEANDLVVWANMPVVGPGMAKQLEDRQQDILGLLDIQSMGAAVPEMTMALNKAMIGELFGAAKQSIKDAQSAMFTLRISDMGITLGNVGTFKAGTPMGDFVAAQKPAKPVTLQGLPSGNVLLAGAWSWDGKTTGNVLADVLKRLMTNEAIAKEGGGAKAEDIAKLSDLYRQLITMTNGMSVVMLDKGIGAAAAGGAGAEAAAEKGAIHGVVLLETAEPAKVIALTLELFRNPLAKQFGTGNPDILQEIVVSPEPIEVKEELKFTRVDVKWSLRKATADKPLSPGSQEMFTQFSKIHGNSMTIHLGEIGKRMVCVIGNDPATLEAAVNAAQTDSNDLANNHVINVSKDQIVPNTVGVYYAPVTRWMDLAQMLKTGKPVAGGGGGGGDWTPPFVGSAGITGTTLT
ncbi:MAG: hypothetical protein FWD53_11120, partial [Phycisphaerales bacterium]|nr:hypothetical protein [Phycisphaerales bacterium]